MSGSLNRVTLIGHLGRDPEIRRMPSGDPIANLSVATSETWRDKASGERKERTEWHRITIFNKGTAEFVEKYLRKGAKVYVEGSLQTRKYKDRDGTEKYSTEIVIKPYNGQVLALDNTSRNDRGDDRPAGQTTQASSYETELDDEIPF